MMSADEERTREIVREVLDAWSRDLASRIKLSREGLERSPDSVEPDGDAVTDVVGGGGDLVGGLVADGGDAVADGHEGSSHASVVGTPEGTVPAGSTPDPAGPFGGES